MSVAIRSCTIVKLVASVLMLLSAIPAGAQIRLNLPAQPLSQSLTVLASLGNVTVIFDERDVDGLKAPALKANLTTDEALDRLLAGTSLHAMRVDASTIRVTLSMPNTRSSAEERRSTNQGDVDRGEDEKAGRSFSDRFRVAQVDSQEAQIDSSVERKTGSSSPRNEKDAKAKLDEVLITGTYIRNVEPISELITLTADELIKWGYTRLDQALDQLPQNFRGNGASQDSNGILNPSGGAETNTTYSSGVNLRGLGSSATLVLLNGRRLPPTSLGNSVDISGIPLSVIDRVEILPDSASAAYGSDAIAGVVNIKTKTTYNGAEASVREDGVAKGKAPNSGGSATFGNAWADGSFVTGVDYDKRNPLFSRDRPFTSSAADPTTLLPRQETAEVYLSTSETLSERAFISGEILASRRKFDQAELNFPGFAVTQNSGRADRGIGAVQLDYSLSDTWASSLVGQFSRERDPFTSEYIGILTESKALRYDLSSFEVRADGPLTRLVDKDLRLAIGANFRREGFYESQTIFPSGIALPTYVQAHRTIGAAYAELFIPVIRDDTARTLIKELSIDVAGRYDHYSDFGSTTNPKIAVRLGFAKDLTFSGIYSSAFKAPTLYQLSLSANNNASVWNATNPASPSGKTTTLLLDSNNPNLSPEKADYYSLGLQYKIRTVPDLTLSTSYFDVDYKDRILRLSTQGFFDNVIVDSQLLGSLVNLNPTVAQVEQQLTVPGRLITNLTGMPYTPSSIGAIANIGYVNVGSSRVRGIDASAHYTAVTSAGTVVAQSSFTHFLRFSNRLTPTSPASDIINTPYNPPRWRGNFNVGFERRSWTGYARLNFTGAYNNPQDATCGPGGCAVASWMTVDLSLSYTVPRYSGLSFLKDTRIAIDAFNVLDRQPPYLNNSLGQLGARSGINYDTVNASPLGRTVGLTLSKRF